MENASEDLRRRIAEELGTEWLETPHRILSGRTPAQAIRDGDIEAVEDLLYSIPYIGAS